MKSKIYKTIIALQIIVILTTITMYMGDAGFLMIFLIIGFAAASGYFIWGYESPLKEGDEVYIKQGGVVKTAKYVSNTGRSYYSIIELDGVMREVYTTDLVKVKKSNNEKEQSA